MKVGEVYIISSDSWDKNGLTASVWVQLYLCFFQNNGADQC
jgi:hypothetical protein